MDLLQAFSQAAQTPITIPHVGERTLCQENITKFLGHITNEEYRKIVEDVIEKTRYITWDELVSGINEAFDNFLDFVKAFDLEDELFSIFVPRHFNSSYLMILVLWPRLCANIKFELIQNSEEDKRKGVKHFVFIDDIMYTGTQLCYTIEEFCYMTDKGKEETSENESADDSDDELTTKINEVLKVLENCGPRITSELIPCNKDTGYCVITAFSSRSAEANLISLSHGRQPCIKKHNVKIFSPSNIENIQTQEQYKFKNAVNGQDTMIEPNAFPVYTDIKMANECCSYPSIYLNPICDLMQHRPYTQIKKLVYDKYFVGLCEPPTDL